MHPTITTVTSVAEINNGANGTITAHGVMDWKRVAANRRDDIYRDIPNEYLVPPNLLNNPSLVNLAQNSGILTARELSIISMTATGLLQCIRERKFTAVEVTTAFSKSASIAHQAVCFSS